MTDEQTNLLEEGARIMEEAGTSLIRLSSNLRNRIDEINGTPHPENVTTEQEEDA